VSTRSFRSRFQLFDASLILLSSSLLRLTGTSLDELGTLGTKQLLVFTGFDKPSRLVVHHRKAEKAAELVGPREVLLLFSVEGELQIENLGSRTPEDTLENRSIWNLSSPVSTSAFARENLEDGMEIS